MNYLEGLMEERLAAHEMELFGHMCQPSNQPKSTKPFFAQFCNSLNQNQPNTFIGQITPINLGKMSLAITEEKTCLICFSRAGGNSEVGGDEVQT